MKYDILSKINCPNDIKTLDIQGLELLCDEIRDKLLALGYEVADTRQGMKIRAIER